MEASTKHIHPINKVKKMTFREKMKQLRKNFTPQAWIEIWEATKALGIVIYTFGNFFVYPFIQACKAFWMDVIKPFWSHVKVAWGRLGYRIKNLWKEIKDVFKKKEEIPVEPPTIPWQD